MIAQRPPGSAPVVKGVAEELPFEDGSFDAAMALITVHHWNDVAAGLAEMVRVARRRVIVLTFDPAPIEDLWIVRDYFPGAFDNHAAVMPPIEELTAMLPGAEIETVPIPARCADGFFIALWDRPELLLDPDVRRASSSMHQIPPEEVERGVAKLRADLESGRWDERNGHLRELPELDIGLRLVSAGWAESEAGGATGACLRRTEGVGFEPTSALRRQQFSRLPRSTAPAPLRDTTEPNPIDGLPRDQPCRGTGNETATSISQIEIASWTAVAPQHDDACRRSAASLGSATAPFGPAVLEAAGGAAGACRRRTASWA